MEEFCTEQIKTHGRWTKMQHQKFLLGLQLYGKDWRKIEQLVATRNGAQIRSHAQKYFVKKGKDCFGDVPVAMEEVTEPVSSKTIEPPAQGFSYFLAKIVGCYSSEEEFDFWGHLIDHKSNDSTSRPIRKGSFITISSQSSNEYQQPPSKRIKSDYTCSSFSALAPQQASICHF